MWTYKLFNDYRVEPDGRVRTVMGMVVVVDLYKDGRFSGWSSRVQSAEWAETIGQRTCAILNEQH